MFGDQIAGGEVSQEPDFDVVAESGAEQVDQFGNYQDGYEISSTRIETSREPLLPAPAAINFRRPVRPPR